MILTVATGGSEHRGELYCRVSTGGQAHHQECGQLELR